VPDVVVELNGQDVVVSVNPITVGLGVSTQDAVVNVSLVEASVSVEGVPGPPGPNVDPNDYFQTALKFAELDTPQKKIDARTNLELQYIDCGTFN
jgi:hypothetical protein